MLFFQVSNSLVLRQFSLTDAADFFELVNQNKKFLSQWMPWPEHIEGIKDAQAFIRYNTNAFQSDQGMALGIWEHNNLIGEVSLTSLDRVNDICTLGYWLSESFTGKGKMSEVLSFLCPRLKEALSINRIEVRIQVENKRSISMIQKLGFMKEALLKNACKVNDRYYDVELYSKLL